MRQIFFNKTRFRNIRICGIFRAWGGCVVCGKAEIAAAGGARRLAFALFLPGFLFAPAYLFCVLLLRCEKNGLPRSGIACGIVCEIFWGQEDFAMVLLFFCRSEPPPFFAFSCGGYFL
ncbi:MAG: hypothetical protein DBX55_02090 [Verrucomicrobia bacterium]|nr:MAG: hypothetical protein DBX55_02090 [Verrucomicrobiota bacterium]